MIDIAQLRRIETLSHPNEVVPVEMPALEPTDADYKAAHEAVHQLGSRLTVETILEAVAARHCRERQLNAALSGLAVAEADTSDSHDIIKQWRAYYGFALDENGELQYVPVPMN